MENAVRCHSSMVIERQSFCVHDVIVPVATCSHSSSYVRVFNTEHAYKIILLQFLLMTMKANEYMFVTPLKFQNDTPVGNNWLNPIKNTLDRVMYMHALSIATSSYRSNIEDLVNL